MSAKCRVCHRPLSNPAHIAAGVGPICAQRAARFGVGGGAPAVATYPAERLARIERNVARCAAAIERAERNRSLAYDFGTADDQQFAEWLVWLTIRWYQRWTAIERRARQLAATRAA